MKNREKKNVLSIFCFKVVLGRLHGRGFNIVFFKFNIEFFHEVHMVNLVP